jgi:hypothetical protein
VLIFLGVISQIGSTMRLGATFAPERETRTPSLTDALDYIPLLAETRPRGRTRPVRWHGRLETEAPFLSLADSQLALAALTSLCAGEREADEILRRLLRRAGPTVVPRVT